MFYCFHQELDCVTEKRDTLTSMQTVRVHLPARQTRYEIKIGSGLIGAAGEYIRASSGNGARRAALISNQTVFDLYGNATVRSLRAAKFDVAHWSMKDGEPHKSLRSLEQALAFLIDFRLERNDVVVALGGGVVGDLAGFAAATYLRGIAFVQVPTTLLAQIDASVGGKVGVNTSAGKNLVGAFHQPRSVLIDTDTLRTLPRRELTAGWCEAVKHGAVGDRKLFDRTVKLLGTHASGELCGEEMRDELASVIAAHCRFKASIVAGDERESTARADARSRKILNFGHTTAHALEAVTGYERFRHGEAVGYGMLVAGEISDSLGMFNADALELLRQAVRACGELPRADDISVHDLMTAMKADKKSINGNIKWVLLEAIGKARVVDGREISNPVLRNALRAGLQRLE
ncbi:MAG TPA: 3-dehydroquinate synthase [Pyrinomonadaceae bacterium]|jgi:3-dehydroquinate synthase|nr:3-dehydroquinate synthase [Pyrinomonadaceae bacterium]